MPFKEITMKELHEKLGSLGPKDKIIDVRSPEEYKDGHVPGSKNIPHTEVTKFIDELRGFENVYIHCQMGGRAQRAASALEKAGLQNIVCVSISGMGDWISLGYPIQKH